MKKIFIFIFSILLLPNIVNAAEDNYVASINSTNYTTLAEAINKSNENDTITLLNNAVLSETTKINKSLTFDLNGYNIESEKRVFEIHKGNVKFTGTGKIKETVPSTAPIVVKGSNNINDKNYTIVTIDKGVVLEGSYGFFVTPFESGKQPVAYGVTINFNGEVNNVLESGAYVNGQIKHKENFPVINIGPDAKIKSKKLGIYAAGYAKWNIDSANIVGDTGLGIKSGIFNLNNTIINATGEAVIPPAGFGNGMNIAGTAIQIESNTGYAGEIKIFINGGTYTSKNSLSIYEYIGAGLETNLSILQINDGTFTSAPKYENYVFSDKFIEEDNFVISGGTYSLSNPSEYLSEGLKIVDNGNGCTVMKPLFPASKLKILEGKIVNGNNATIQLVQGGDVVITSLADENGDYYIEGIPTGIYNVLITGENSSTMAVADLTKHLVLNITLPNTGSIKVKSTKGTPDIVVDGLQNIAIGSNIEMKLNKVIESEEIKNIVIQDIKADNYEYFDFSLFKDSTNLDTTTNILTIGVPFDFIGKDKVLLARIHDGKVQKFSELNEIPSTKKDQTYYLDKENSMIYIYTNKFSTYTIASTKEIKIENPKTSDNINKYLLLGLSSLCGMFILSKKRI